MPGVASNGPRYRFGPFELNTGEESLARNGVRVKVQDLPYRLLKMLVERPGEIVTREEVRQRLWPENTSDRLREAAALLKALETSILKYHIFAIPDIPKPTS